MIIIMTLVFRMKLVNYLLFCSSCTFVLVSSNNNVGFNYENKQKFGMGHRVIEDYRRVWSQAKHNDFGYDHPTPLPTSKAQFKQSRFHSIYQGIKKKGDRRAYNQKFDYEADVFNGHQVHCEAILDCFITHIAVETDTGIPILLRGGAGYRYFTVIVKVPVGKAVSGRVRAYCSGPKTNKEDGQYQKAYRKVLKLNTY